MAQVQIPIVVVDEVENTEEDVFEDDVVHQKTPGSLQPGQSALQMRLSPLLREHMNHKSPDLPRQSCSQDSLSPMLSGQSYFKDTLSPMSSKQSYLRGSSSSMLSDQSDVQGSSTSSPMLSEHRTPRPSQSSKAGKKEAKKQKKKGVARRVLQNGLKVIRSGVAGLSPSMGVGVVFGASPSIPRPSS